jgi:ribosome-associated protein
MVKLSKTNPGDVALLEQDPSMDEILRIIHDTIDARKGENVLILDVSEQVDYLDYLIIANGLTALHNRAIMDYVIGELARYDIMPDGLNGYENGEWILADFGVMTVHLFTPALREFYRLEELWAAGRVVEMN